MDAFPRRFGSYILLKPLARGGMGALYLSVSGERGMEKLCVIKTVLPHLADKEYLRRFRDEAKVVVRLSHGNLVAVFDAGQVEGKLYLAMDFVEGKDLRVTWNRCAQTGIAFPIDVAAYIVKELARGLGYAHGFGSLKLVHRDVSPPNVLLAYSGEVKLTDFGLASSTLKLEKTAPGVIYGKVSYMTPEQASGEPLDGRTDLYAAGIILWELLTGRQLFPSSSPGAGGGAGEPPPAEEVLKRVRDPKIEPPSRRAARVPPELDRIAMRALALLPADRYQSGEELRADLASYLARTAPSTDTDRVARFLRDLFGDDIERERAEREALLAGAAVLHATPSGATAATLTPRGLGEPPGTGAEGPLFSLDEARDRRRADPGVWGEAGSFLLDPGSSSAATMPAHEEVATDIVGSLLGGRYRVRRMCGEGGMGKVYEAEHVEIGKRVALKVLHPVYSRTPDVVERFRREARSASRIGHPNIVNVTDSGTTPDGSFYFVMEFLEGIELGILIHRQGPLPVERALPIAAQMCRALQAAHDAGVVHRDLKPENILLIEQDGQSDFVKVLDFGIAKSAEMEENAEKGRRLTHPGMAMGTPEYMAPEQAAGRVADPRSDIYAVGAILYEMLTGVPPYEGQNFMEILHKKANEMPRPAVELRADLPPSVEALLARAMAKEPDDRPATMAHLEQEIAAILTGPGAERRRPDERSGRAAPEASERVGLRETPWRRVAGTAGLAAVAVAVVGVLSWTFLPASGPRSSSGTAARPSAGVTAQAATPAHPARELVRPEDTEDPVATVAKLPSMPPSVRPPAVPAAAPAAVPTASDGRRLLADGERLFAAGRFAEARAAFEKARADAKAPRAPALIGLGQIAFQEGRYQEAVGLLKQSLAFGGGAKARVLLGDALFKLQRYAEAVSAYQRALKLEPDNPVAKQGLANASKRLD